MNKENESHLKFLGVHAEVIEFMKNQQSINKMELLTAKEAREIANSIDAFDLIMDQINVAVSKKQYFISPNYLLTDSLVKRFEELGFTINETVENCNGLACWTKLISW
jgi:hypothetical protein